MKGTEKTYSVALTAKQIRSLKMLAETIAKSHRWGADTKEFHRDIANTLQRRLDRIEAEKGGAS